VAKGQAPPPDYFVQMEETTNKNVVSVMDERKKAGEDLFILISNKPFHGNPEKISDGIVICAQNLRQFFCVFGTANVCFLVQQ